MGEEEFIIKEWQTKKTIADDGDGGWIARDSSGVMRIWWHDADLGIVSQVLEVIKRDDRAPTKCSNCGKETDKLYLGNLCEDCDTKFEHKRNMTLDLERGNDG